MFTGHFYDGFPLSKQMFFQYTFTAIMEGDNRHSIHHNSFIDQETVEFYSARFRQTAVNMLPGKGTELLISSFLP